MIPATLAAPRLSFRLGRVARWSCAALLTASCGGSAATEPASDSPATSGAVSANGQPANAAPGDQGSQEARRTARSSIGANAWRGARLYDNFYKENRDLGFSPDDPTTPTIDGSGGPSGDGTLPDGGGATLDNTLDHGYRLSSLFGWDLRGARGINGPAYQDRAYVAPFDLLDDSLSRDQVAAVIVDGAPGVPAYGSVLSEQDLGDLVAFIMAVRGGEWLQPGDVWHLDAASPSGYVLKPGGRVELGHAMLRSACSGCHGADGTNLLFHTGEFSLGSLARGNADEVWFKLMAGSAGTPMASMIPIEAPWQEQAQVVLDVLAALCDRVAYPPGVASEPDAPADDGCGYYLR